MLSGIAGNPKFNPITDKIRQVDYHGKFTAAAGHALYTARLYPREYWNKTAFVAEPTGHLVATFPLTKIHEAMDLIVDRKVKGKIVFTTGKG